MKFTKEFLQEKVCFAIYDEIIDTSRWSAYHEMVFEHEGKYYMTEYSEGLTECQDESPFEYSDDEIECCEVELKEVTVKKWMPKN